MNSEPCLLCGAAAMISVRPYRTESPAGRTLFGNTHLHRCTACDFVQMAPQPSRERLEHYYSEAYRQGGRHGSGVANIKDFPRDNKYFMHRGESITALLAPRIMEHLGRDNPRILDVGAGFGHLLHALGERFPQSTRAAVEISQVCVDHLRGLGVTVHQAASEDVLAGLTEQFDVITLSHVLEHLREPARVLTLLRERLAPGGLLYIEVPHIPVDSLTRYIDHAWAPRHDEPHLTFFTRKTLRDALERAGLRVEFCDAAGPQYADVSWATFHVPTPKALVMRLLPEAIKRTLRQQKFASSMSIFDHAEPFHQYGGRGIWLRSISSR